MKKRCREAEEHERNDNNNNNNTNNTKKKTTLSISPAEAAATWSELPLDALGEIKKKLFWRDHVRFSSVCKTWLSAQHAERASDVLPWLLLLDRENLSRVSYYMYEPSASHPDPVISQGPNRQPIGSRSYISSHCGIVPAGFVSPPPDLLPLWDNTTSLRVPTSGNLTHQAFETRL
ncbi:hypothetical protein AgCh_002980 [Apium graveolens]